MSFWIYALLGILISFLEWRRRSSGEPLNAMTAFNCYYFVLFVFVPINVMYFGEDVIRQRYAYETYGSGDTSTALSVFFCYVLFSLGWLKSPARQKSGLRRGTLSLCDSARVAKIIFFLGVILTVIYVIQIGGVSEAISKAAEVRSGAFEIESKFIGYRHLSRFSADAFVLFIAVLLGKRARNMKITTQDKVFLLWASLFFVYYALSTAGRRPFLEPILLCFLIHWSIGAKVRKTAVAALALIFIIAGLGSFLGSIVLNRSLSTVFDIAEINRADWRALLGITYDNASQGLGDSYIHFVAAQKASLWQFGFLNDIVNLPRDFLPSRLLGFERNQELADQLSDFMLGQRIPEGESGGEPLGLHGYLLVNFGYAGMFALFFVLGLFYKWIHVRFKPAEPRDAVGWLIYWWFVLGFFVYFREGFIIFALKAQLTWWLIVALLVYRQAKWPAQPHEIRNVPASAPPQSGRNSATST
jgi:hypothetical protein